MTFYESARQQQGSLEGRSSNGFMRPTFHQTPSPPVAALDEELEDYSQLYSQIERQLNIPTANTTGQHRLSAASNVTTNSGIYAMYTDRESGRPTSNGYQSRSSPPIQSPTLDMSNYMSRSLTQSPATSFSPMSLSSSSSGPIANGLPSRPLPRHPSGPRALGQTSGQPSRSFSSSSQSARSPSLYSSREADERPQLSERQASKRPMRDDSTTYAQGLGLSHTMTSGGAPSDRILLPSRPLPEPNSNSPYPQRMNSLNQRNVPSRSPSIIATPPAMSFTEEQSSPVSRFPTPSRSNTLSPKPTSSTILHRNFSATTMTSLAPSSIIYEDETVHINQALLSNLAVYLRDHVPRAEHTRGAIPYPMSFTGSDITTTIMRALPDMHKNRRIALHIAKSLHSQLFFFEVRDNTKMMDDGLDQVYTFIEEEEQFTGTAWSFSPGSRKVDDWEELPTGVFTEVTSCYSPLCARLSTYGSGGGGCFSPSCPNNLKAVLLTRQASTASDSATTAPTVDTRAWVELQRPELLEHLRATEGEREIDRQNRIFELITTEANYVHELELLRTEFLEPLTEAEPPIIPADSQSSFFSEVLGNVFEVKEHAMTLCEALLNRQREHTDVIQNIADVVLNTAVDWGQAYTQFARHFPFAKARLAQERERNPAFDQFLNTFSRRPATLRREFAHFHQNPLTRLQRYPLMLRSVLGKTPPENSDQDELEQVVEMIERQLNEADAATGASSAVLECRGYQHSLIGHGGMISDLDLYSEQRQIFITGRMYRRPDSSGFSVPTPLHVILFDHYLVLTKEVPTKSGGKRHQISRRPIPLELLTAIGFDEPPQPRSSRLHLLRGNSSEPPTASVSSSTKDSSDKMLYPITFNYLGRQGGIFFLFVETDQIRKEWKAKLGEAQSLRKAVLEENRIFETVTMSSEIFASRSSRISDSMRRDGMVVLGRPTCSCFFTTPEGHPLIAVGHDEGLWIGLRHDPSSYRLVLHLKNITQCAVLQDYGLLLVLANKVLIAYPLEALVPSAQSSQVGRENKEPQRLSGSKDVQFFKVGIMKSRLLVIYVKKDGVTQTVFKALEPIAVADRGTRGFMRKRQDWFREYKEFFIPSDVFGLFFLKSQLSIVCARGFELMPIDREPLRATSFPDWSQLRSDPKAMELQKRCHESKAVAMFRISESQFLFVFEDLAFYADKHGDPLADRYKDIIEWQGTARAVAFCKGHVLAFDSNFVEIRDASSGKLVQIIQGLEILCLNDGQGLGPETGKANGAYSDGEKAVHMALLNRIQGKGDFYSVVEIVPSASTILSPSLSNYL